MVVDYLQEDYLEVHIHLEVHIQAVEEYYLVELFLFNPLEWVPMEAWAAVHYLHYHIVLYPLFHLLIPTPSAVLHIPIMELPNSHLEVFPTVEEVDTVFHLVILQLFHLAEHHHRVLPEGVEGVEHRRPLHLEAVEGVIHHQLCLLWAPIRKVKVKKVEVEGGEVVR